MATIEYYFENVEPGAVLQLGSRTVTAEEIVAFAREFDPQPFHIDPEAASYSIFGGLIASGWHICSMTMRLLVEQYLSRAASLGSPGVDQIRWLRPVRPGDTLRAVRTVLEARVSRSKPDVGIVKTRWDVYNQADEPVMTMEGYGMFQVRHPGGEA